MLDSVHSSAPLPRVAVIVGSNRRDSINRKLAQALARLGAGKFDATFARIDDLPMFNQAPPTRSHQECAAAKMRTI
jgi:NAD(P)H-dependent FMN reductase